MLCTGWKLPVYPGSIATHFNKNASFDFGCNTHFLEKLKPENETWWKGYKNLQFQETLVGCQKYTSSWKMSPFSKGRPPGAAESLFTGQILSFPKYFQFLTIPTSSSMFQFIVTFTMIPQCQFIVDEFVILGLVLCNSCNSNRNRCYWCNFFAVPLLCMQLFAILRFQYHKYLILAKDIKSIANCQMLW